MTISATGEKTHRMRNRSATAATFWDRRMVVVFLLALALRLVLLGRAPFQDGDDLTTVWPTVLVMPHAWDQLLLRVDSFWHSLVMLEHGPVPAVIGSIWAYLALLLNMPLVETTWHLPFAVLGSLISPLVYALTATLQSRRAGFLAALFVAVIPLHVAFSRTSGETHFVLASLFQVTSLLLWLRYLGSRRWPLALATGVLVTLDALVDFFFPGLLVTLLIAAYVSRLSGEIRKAAVKGALADLVQPAIFIPMVLGLQVHVYALHRYLCCHQAVGMLGRVLSESEFSYTRVGGFFIKEALGDLTYVAGAITVVAVGACLIALPFTDRVHRRRQAIVLAWATSYLFPLVFLFNRDRLVGHYIPVTVSLLVFVALALDRMRMSGPKCVLRVLSAGVVFASMLLTTLSMVYGIHMPGIFERPLDHGSVGIDRGTKAAALWVRRNTPPSAIIWADAGASQAHPVVLYYFHRAVFSGYGERGEAAEFKRLLDNLDLVDIVLIGEENLKDLPQAARDEFERTVEVHSEGQPPLLILTRDGPAAGHPEIVLARTDNARYDELFGAPAVVLWPPLSTMRAEMVKFSGG